MLYSSKTWTVKDNDMIRFERNDVRAIQWKCNVRPEGRILTQKRRDYAKIEQHGDALTG